MKLHCIQHVPFEGPANIGDWAENQGWKVSGTHLYRQENLPDHDDLDWLVVMGGPMNIYEEKEYPWLAAEKKFIEKAIARDKIVIGICLGAQLIADVLGGPVVRNRYKEIGWFPIRLRPEGAESAAFKGFPARFQALHWHGDTFSLPPGAAMLAESKACLAQAFSFNGGRVLALQFHLESSMESVSALVENCSDELVDGEYIQSADAILEKKENFSTIRDSMRLLLENMKKAF
ncbi:Glutamine amidotransferase class-I [Syntrophobacter sp. SbD1]|nr:Glutamine amidotransferase class-I [Syntrophobacter sp. SbD1]